MTKVVLKNPGTQFSKNAVDFFNSVIETDLTVVVEKGAQGETIKELTIKEYLEQPQVTLGDLYNHYEQVYSKVANDRSKYPDAYMGYTGLDTRVERIKNNTKKLDPK
jgi:hypothetical protein